MGTLRILFQNENVLGIDKPAAVVVFAEGKIQPVPKTLIDDLLEQFPDLKNTGKPPRYGLVHRLDKETSGILLIAKNNKTLEFLQRQFKKGKVLKKYLALVVGDIKNSKGKIETLLGREPKKRKKQRVYLPFSPDGLKRNKKLAITEYQVLERYTDEKNYYTLVEISPKTGRKHQIRCHFAYLGHPIAGDKMYGFKKQPCPKNLERQFLHASYLKIKMPDGKTKELRSSLPQDLQLVLDNLKMTND